MPLVVVDKRQVAQGERSAPGELPARALEAAHVDELRDRTARVEHGHAGCRQLDRVLADGTDQVEDRAPGHSSPHILRHHGAGLGRLTWPGVVTCTSCPRILTVSAPLMNSRMRSSPIAPGLMFQYPLGSVVVKMKGLASSGQ